MLLDALNKFLQTLTAHAVQSMFLLSVIKTVLQMCIFFR